MFNSKLMEQRQANPKVNDQTDNQKVERYAIRDFDNDAHENESTVKG